MPDPSSNALSIVEAFFDALQAKNLDAILPLLADDVVEVIPYSPTGTPEPWGVFDGKEAVMGYLTTITQNFSQGRLTEVQSFVSADGCTVFVEANGDLVQRDTAASYRNVYVFKFALAGGRITRISEYANPVPIAVLLG
jgi:ketosteroid isomerase-like protein